MRQNTKERNRKLPQRPRPSVLASSGKGLQLRPPKCKLHPLVLISAVSQMTLDTDETHQNHMPQLLLLTALAIPPGLKQLLKQLFLRRVPRQQSHQDATAHRCQPGWCAASPRCVHILIASFILSLGGSTSGLIKRKALPYVKNDVSRMYRYEYNRVQ